MYTLPSDTVASTVYFTKYLDPSKDIVITFDFACYGPVSMGSEGFCVFLSDTSFNSIRYGGPGPGLGYSSVSGVKANTRINFPGLLGGVIGVGFDITGNFSSNKYSRTGLSITNKNSITIRGSHTSYIPKLSGYPYLTSTNNLYYYNPLSPFNIYEQITDNRLPAFKTARVRLSDFGMRLLVDLKNPQDEVYTNYLDYNLSGSVVWPESIRIGLAFSTGLQTNTIFKIKNFNLNGVFTDVISPDYNIYSYNIDPVTLQGSTISYVKAISALLPGDLLSVTNVGTYNAAYSGSSNPLMYVDPQYGPEGAPYLVDDDFVKITPI